MNSGSRHSNLVTMRVLWRVLTSEQRRHLLLLIAVAAIMSVCTLGGVAAILPFFSALADPAATMKHPLLGGLRAAIAGMDHDTFVLLLGAAFVLMVFVANGVNLLGTLAIQRFSLRIGGDLQVALFEEYLHRDLPFHTRNSATALANNIVYETHRVATGTLQNMLLLVTSAFSGVLIVVSVVAVNWRFALSAGLSLGAIYTALYLLARRRLVRNGAREVELFDARARTLSEGFGAIRELLLVRNQHLFRDALARQSREIARVASGTLAITHSPRYVLEFFAAASLAAAAVIMSGAGSAQWITQLSFLGLAAYRLLPALQQAFAAMAHLRADHGAFLRVAEDLQSARAAPPRRVPPADPHWQGRPQRELVLNEIQFAYDVDSRFAIRNASLKIGAGSIVGLVGANGSGKTTLAEIMLGLLTPHSGTITVDGLPVDENSRVSWQSNVAYVPQQVFVLDASLADNIVFGATSLDEARVREVAERVGVAHLLDQPLGERGVRLSGGQRQRIGIARALYRNATFLVLDEATSALDAPAESELVETLHSLRGRQTVVLLAHRVSSLSQCDQIVELDAGTVVPRGDYRDYLGYLERSRKFGAAGS